MRKNVKNKIEFHYLFIEIKLSTTRHKQHCEMHYHNPSLGFATKARVCEGASQEWSPGVTFMLPRMWESVREWTPTFPNEFPFWKLESQWTFESSEGDFRVQNSLNLRVPYIIGNILELRCLKWACIAHLGS